MPDWLPALLILGGMIALSLIGAAVITLSNRARRRAVDPYRKPHGEVPRVPEYWP